ncbi:universal stress protein [Thermosulfurimonas sp.]|uniref:universal stress protein n=1 Tax=Thermosulfurimonas sp. TaxID=2080236 RepID=UPI0025F4074B|nr:universal stress protein [Thermosulfurimonas sp.]
MEEAKTHLMGDIKTVLLAVDASEECRGAVQQAVSFVLECKAKLYILYVREYYPEIPEALLEAIKGIPEEHRAFLEEIKNMVEKEGGEAEIIIHELPEAWKVIVEEARKRQADLIILGKRGHGGLEKLLMGSVAQKVIGYAPCKVMVVPREAEVRGETLLVATDGSYHAKKAEKEAINMAKRCTYVKKLVGVSVAHREEELPLASTILQAFKVLAEEEELPSRVKLEILPVVGNPAEVIVRIAQDEKADLIIMGAYGKTGLKRFFMGSITAKVIGHSEKTAILVVP